MIALARRSGAMIGPLALLMACAAEPVDESEPGLTAAEDRQLDAAAERLDREREEYEAGLAAQQALDAAAAARAPAPTGGADEAPPEE